MSNRLSADKRLASLNSETRPVEGLAPKPELERVFTEFAVASWDDAAKLALTDH